jgi:exodeoxyribonuclease VII small subunit
MLPDVAKHPEPAAPPPDFEASLAELEQLVERLERGEQTLEQALADFERGVRLARTCQDALARAELRVRELAEPDGVAPALSPAADESA